MPSGYVFFLPHNVDPAGVGWSRLLHIFNEFVKVSGIVFKPGII